jgi:hypothetical protein
MQSKTTTLTLVTSIILSGLLLTGCTKTATTPETKPVAQPAAQAANPQLAQVKFQKEIGLNEEVTVEYKNGSAGAVGKMTFLVKEVGEKPKLSQAIAGQTYYYAIYDVKGDADNSKAADGPRMFVDPSAPQIALLDKAAIQSVGGSMGGTVGFEALQQEYKDIVESSILNPAEPKLIHTGATWYTTKVDKPIVAIQYTDAQGNKQYIKINW